MNNHTKIIRWGIVGCGNVTEVKSGPAYQQTAGFELAAVMRRNEEKVIDYAKRHKVLKWYTDAKKIIHDPEIDAIYIATPPDTHLKYGLMVAKAGKPCCIEKPLTPSYEESKKLVAAFHEKNVPLFIAYYRRSLPRFHQIKTWINSGKIGDIRHIHVQLCKPPNSFDLSRKENWRTDAEIAPGGYFDDLASHQLDLFAYWFGNFKTASGIAINQQGLYSAKDAVVACWEHENGTTGIGNWNFGSAKREDKATIYGSEGMISCAIFDEQPIILQNKEGTRELHVDNPKHIQLHHVQNIQKDLAGISKHPSTGENGLHTSWVMDKILGKI